MENAWYRTGMGTVIATVMIILTLMTSGDGANLPVVDSSLLPQTQVIFVEPTEVEGD